MASTPTPTKPQQESFLEKLDTIRKKKKKNRLEVEELTKEGRQAIEANQSPLAPDLGPEGYQLEEGEERSMIEPYSKDLPKVKKLIDLLLSWINSEVVDHRILVRDIEEDLYDGQVLQKLVEKLAGIKIDHPEVTQSEMGQKQRLKLVLEEINRQLGVPESWASQRWSVDAVHGKDLVSILRLLVTLARHFRAAIRLPEDVTLTVLIVRKLNGMLQHRRETEPITEPTEDALAATQFDRDAFDTLLECAPEKLNLVCQSLTAFLNSHLSKLSLEVHNLETQIRDGVFLVLLLGLLEGYFVPLHAYNLTPRDFDQQVANVTLAFELMQEAGLPRPKARPEDIVNGDLKSILRVLYALFSRYKETAATPTPTSPGATAATATGAM